MLLARNNVTWTGRPPEGDLFFDSEGQLRYDASDVWRVDPIVWEMYASYDGWQVKLAYKYDPLSDRLTYSFAMKTPPFVQANGPQRLKAVGTDGEAWKELRMTTGGPICT